MSRGYMGDVLPLGVSGGKSGGIWEMSRECLSEEGVSLGCLATPHTDTERTHVRRHAITVFAFRTIW